MERWQDLCRYIWKDLVFRWFDNVEWWWCHQSLNVFILIDTWWHMIKLLMSFLCYELWLVHTVGQHTVRRQYIWICISKSNNLSMRVFVSYLKYDDLKAYGEWTFRKRSNLSHTYTPFVNTLPIQHQYGRLPYTLKIWCYTFLNASILSVIPKIHEQQY